MKKDKIWKQFIKKYLLTLGLTFYLNINILSATEVPKTIHYAGIQLILAENVRKQIQKQVDFIERNPLAFATMCEKASMYFPIIKEAFRHIGVPEDLIFIAIQESGLRGNAISPSLAVGYWQLKDFTAKEVGLMINKNIDERRHIFRASIGAARYFYKQWLRYDNWLYAVIAYYEGGTGAEPYTQAKYIGAKKMYLTSLHWYAVKAIAHKLAYQNHIPYPPQKQWVRPKPLEKKFSISELSQKENLTLAQFKELNPWALRPEFALPVPISYYTIEKGKHYTFTEDPYKHQFDPPARKTYFPNRYLTQNQQIKKKNKFLNKKEKTTETPPPTPNITKVHTKKRKPNPKPPANIAVFFIEKDPLYGKQFTILKPHQSLTDIAFEYAIKEKKLRKWNKFLRGQKLEPYQFILLVPPRKAQVHIVGKYESLQEIAMRYRKKTSKLAKLNRLKSEHTLLYYGQKLYLKKLKPIDEKLIVYTFQKPPLLRYTELREREELTKNNDKGFFLHIVKKGETLWSIARRYQVPINKLQHYNQLKSTTLAIGTRLKIPKKNLDTK